MMKTEAREVARQQLKKKYGHLLDLLLKQEMTATEIGKEIGTNNYQKIWGTIFTLSLSFPIYETDDQPPKLKILTKEDLKNA